MYNEIPENPCIIYLKNWLRLFKYTAYENTALHNTNAQINIAKTNHLQSTNVIGVLPGTDKKDEYIFITAIMIIWQADH
jgi:hypothetical protein